MSWFYEKEKKQNKIIYHICGIKFTLKRRNEKKILLNIEDFIHKSISPQSLPKATGILRDIQLASLKILLEVDRICKENNINYWLDFGALLGAVRHKDFIPWDDDIDIGMLREDYDKFIKIFNEKTSDNNLYIEYYCHPKGTFNLVKICHKDIKNIFVDIFPYDFYIESLDCEGKINLHNKITKLKKNLYKYYNSKTPKQAWFNRFLEIRDKEIYQGKTPNLNQKPALFWGMEFNHTWGRCVFDYETFFPLSEVEFCGYKIPAPADIDLYLTSVYRDYMSLPQSLHYHADLSQISVEEIMLIKKYAKGEL